MTVEDVQAVEDYNNATSPDGGHNANDDEDEGAINAMLFDEGVATGAVNLFSKKYTDAVKLAKDKKKRSENQKEQEHVNFNRNLAEMLASSAAAANHHDSNNSNNNGDIVDQDELFNIMDELSKAAPTNNLNHDNDNDDNDNDGNNESINLDDAFDGLENNNDQKEYGIDFDFVPDNEHQLDDDDDDDDVNNNNSDRNNKPRQEATTSLFYGSGTDGVADDDIDLEEIYEQGGIKRRTLLGGGDAGDVVVVGDGSGTGPADFYVSETDKQKQLQNMLDELEQEDATRFDIDMSDEARKARRRQRAETIKNNNYQKPTLDSADDAVAFRSKLAEMLKREET